jgi:hypothetical protein
MTENIASTAMTKDENKNPLSRLQEEFDSLSILQEEVAESRLQVLIDRQSLTSSTKRLRRHRDLTSNAAARLMDAFRTHFIGSEQAIPDYLTLAYSEVEKHQNDLIDAEDTHAEIVQALELSEWTLTEKEEDLYQRDLRQILQEVNAIVSDQALGMVKQEESSRTRTNFPPSTGIRYQVDMLELRRLTRKIHNVSRNHANADDFGLEMVKEDVYDIEESYVDLAAEQESEQILEQIIDYKVMVQQSKASLQSSDCTGIVRLKAVSEPDLGTPAFVGSPLGQRRHSDGGPRYTGIVAPDVVPVGEWLLNCLMENAAEKMHYMALLQRKISSLDRLNFDDWEERVIRSWDSDLHSYDMMLFPKESFISSAASDCPKIPEWSNSMPRRRCSSDPGHADRQTPLMPSDRRSCEEPFSASNGLLSVRRSPKIASMVDRKPFWGRNGLATDKMPLYLSIVSTNVSFPELGITAPQNQDIPEIIPISSPMQLCVTHHILPRRDSAQNSDNGHQKRLAPQNLLHATPRYRGA